MSEARGGGDVGKGDGLVSTPGQGLCRGSGLSPTGTPPTGLTSPCLHFWSVKGRMVVPGRVVCC